MRAGIEARIVGVVALAAVAPTILVGALAVRRARHDVRTEVVRKNLAVARALGAALDGAMQDARRSLSLAAAAWADGAELRRVHAQVKRQLPIVGRAAFYDVEARPIGGDPLLLPIERANTYGGYIAEASCEEGPACRRVVVVAQARGRTGELAGFVVAELNLGFVEAALATARLPRGAHLFVVDSHGAEVASQAAEAARGRDRPSQAAVTRALAAADEGSLETDGVLAVFRNLASFQTTRGVGWAIILEQPTREAYALARATTRDTLIVGLAVLAAALAASSHLARRMTRPLVELARHVDAFATRREAGGEPAPGGRGTDAAPPVPPLPRNAPGEIGALARRFEEMERRVAERERLQAELARGAQLASVGALAAGVAHEINNPLTTILGYASLLLEDKPEGHPDRAALELVADEARRVQGIVRTLLDHARVETGPPRAEPVDVNAAVERTAALLQPTLRKRGVELLLELATALPQPAADARRLEQVFVNLAQNAAQAMESGGRLAIRTRVGEGDAVVVEFEDSGPGIPEEHLARIFEPFFTTKGPGVGTGLGLAISHRIVTEHGGRIEVESHLGRGSTFRVILAGGRRT